MTMYFEGSNAAGALYEFIFITDSGAVDFTRSALVALNRSTSENYVLPFSLSVGQYRVFVYDIEQNGTVWGGVQYPASRDEVTINESNSGTKCDSVDYYNCIFLPIQPHCFNQCYHILRTALSEKTLYRSLYSVHTHPTPRRQGFK